MGRVLTSARSHLRKLRAQTVNTFCYNSQARRLNISDIALQLEGVDNEDVVNTEQHDATGNAATPLVVSENVVRAGLLRMYA